MLKKKCQSCAKKTERKFNYCPYCGAPFKGGNQHDSEDYGMIGRNDFEGEIEEEINLPFGMGKIMNSLVKQLEKQMNEMESDGQIPSGVRIQIANGIPRTKKIQQPKRQIRIPQVSEKEAERRLGLPKVETESKIKRIADTIIYEIKAPGVKRNEDIVLTELATGIEVKAYSEDKCYIKFIPLKIEIVRYKVEKDKVYIEMKG